MAVLPARDAFGLLGVSGRPPTDAIVRIAATSVCGSDLWPYRGLETYAGPTPMGHLYYGLVEEVGSAVSFVRPGQFVIGAALPPRGHQASWDRKIDPRKVFHLILPLDQVAEGYRAMDERRAIKALLRP